MKKIMKKTAGILSGILMAAAGVSVGPGLAEAAGDLLGYMIYLGVFAAPMCYFSIKKKATAI